MSKRLSFLGLVLCFSAPLVALAQGRPIGLAEQKGGRDHALELELDFSSVTFETPTNELTYSTLLPKVYGSFGLTEHLELEATLPTIFVDYSPESGEGDSSFQLANPYVALLYAHRTDRSVARIGGGIALPLLDPDDGVGIMAPALAAWTRGLQDVWLYMPNALSVVVPGQVQMRSSMLVIGIDGALALLLNTAGTEEEDDAELAVQAGALLGAALGDVTLGLRLQLASMVTAEGDDTQVSMLPFIQADLDGGGFVHGGLLVNLDEPLGVFGDGEPDVWALRIGGGTRF
jgi:hypothetical protein